MTATRPALRGSISTSILATGAFMLASLGLPAAAQQPSLEDCRSIENDAERLSCYDEALKEAPAASPAPKAEPAPENPVADFGAEKVQTKDPAPVAKASPPEPEADRQTLLERFGADKIPFRGKKEEQLESITLDIDSFYLQPYGELVVTLENGQVWRQLEPSPSITRRADDKNIKSATIERAALGSYRMKVFPMGKTMKVRRVK